MHSRNDIADEGQVIEATRRWLERADSALRLGDWTSFGRAWTGLRDALGARADSAGR